MVPGSRILVDQLFVLCGLFIFVMLCYIQPDQVLSRSHEYRVDVSKQPHHTDKVFSEACWRRWTHQSGRFGQQLTRGVAPVSPSIQLVRNAEPCMVETIVRWVAFDGPQKKDQLVIVEMLLRA
uniref:Uncharacterized protein n=1 Tax=Globodera rostochiensis TaxID=31243 RepID=A0A914H7S6_GLORO